MNASVCFSVSWTFWNFFSLSFFFPILWEFDLPTVLAGRGCWADGSFDHLPNIFWKCLQIYQQFPQMTFQMVSVYQTIWHFRLAVITKRVQSLYKECGGWIGWQHTKLPVLNWWCCLFSVIVLFLYVIVTKKAPLCNKLPFYKNCYFPQTLHTKVYFLEFPQNMTNLLLLFGFRGYIKRWNEAVVGYLSFNKLFK